MTRRIPVLSLFAVLATNIALCQPIGSPDIRTGVYRGQVVTYEVIDGLAVLGWRYHSWDSRGTRRACIRRAQQGPPRHPPHGSITGDKE